MPIHRSDVFVEILELEPTKLGGKGKLRLAWKTHEDASDEDVVLETPAQFKSDMTNAGATAPAEWQGVYNALLERERAFISAQPA